MVSFKGADARRPFRKLKGIRGQYVAHLLLRGTCHRDAYSLSDRTLWPFTFIGRFLWLDLFLFLTKALILRRIMTTPSNIKLNV